MYFWHVMWCVQLCDICFRRTLTAVCRSKVLKGFFTFFLFIVFWTTSLRFSVNYLQRLHPPPFPFECDYFLWKGWPNGSGTSTHWLVNRKTKIVFRYIVKIDLQMTNLQCNGFPVCWRTQRKCKRIHKRIAGNVPLGQITV